MVRDMVDARPAVLAYYERHPISADRILAALARRGVPQGRLAPEDLWTLDQDHYGGLDAVAVLARRAGLTPGARVLDVCAGIAGPARVLAHGWGARVTALELSPGRCRDAARLTRAVRLERLVRVVRADVQAMPLRPRAFRAVISQEGLLHVPDKPAALRECARVLVPGGRLVFTDWVATARLGDGARRRLAKDMAAYNLETLHGYRRRLGAAGFGALEVEDVSVDWLAAVRRRRETHRALRAAGAPAPGDTSWGTWDQLHAFFASLLETGQLCGARFSATCA